MVGVLLEPPLEVFHVVVLEADELGAREHEAINERGVVFPVGEDEVLAVGQGADAARVAHKAGAPQQHGLLAEVVCELVLQLLVQVQRTVEHPGARAARAEAVECFVCSSDDLGVVGEAQVVVRAQHDAWPAFDDDTAAFAVGQRLEEGVQAEVLHVLVTAECGALVEQVARRHGILRSRGRRG